MTIPFWKMHGAGNDFLLVDDLAGQFPFTDTAWLKRICTRKTGVGCDGVILIQTSTRADFFMRFINPDGMEVDMCGNGARCVARLAFDLNMVSSEMSIETLAGVLKAEVKQESVCLHLMDPTDWELEKTLELDGETLRYSSVNTGVPHVVLEVNGLESLDVESLGRKIRYHREFFPGGTNADFMQITGRHNVRVRTYERGVEAETLACGTGIVATGLVAGRLGKVIAPVDVECANGDILNVAFDLTEKIAENISLTGPAQYVFKGELKYSG